MISTLLDISGPTGGNGGTIEFPSVGTFQFSGGPIVIGVDLSTTTQPYAIIIQGDGQGSEGMPLIQKTDAGDLFQVSNTTTSDQHVGGITFRDLQIDYSNELTSGAAIHVLHGENVRVFRCVFQDCPNALLLEDTLQCNMIDCTVIYPNNPAIAAVQIGAGSITAKETFIAGTTLLSDNNPNGVGILVENADQIRVANTRIEGFQQGILIQPGGMNNNVRRAYFGNVSCYPNSEVSTVGAAVLIQPTDGTWVAQVWFEACQLGPPKEGTEYLGAGVVIDPLNGSGGGGNVDQVRLIGCHVCQWNGPGLELIGAGTSGTQTPSNIEVVGGYYSLNGSNPGSGLPSAGIALVGGTNGPYGVRVVGAACNNSVFFSGGSGGVFLTPTQDYGISIASATQTNLFVHDCDLTGNLSAPISTSGSLTTLHVANCAGYNDQGVAVHSVVPTSATTFFSYSFTTPYYGPVEFYVSGVSGAISQISVDGHATPLKSGSFYLAPGESGQINLVRNEYPDLPNDWEITQLSRRSAPLARTVAVGW
jgi:hypothetical protein